LLTANLGISDKMMQPIEFRIDGAIWRKSATCC